MSEILTMGVLLGVDKLGGETPAYVDIAEITSLDGPNESVSSLDKTVLSSTAREYRPGLYDGGEISVGLYFDGADAEHKWLQGRPKARTIHKWRITIPTEPKLTYIDFSGFVTEFAPGTSGPDEFVTANVSIKVTGDVTYSEAT